jgi:hypothetical protein
MTKSVVGAFCILTVVQLAVLVMGDRGVMAWLPGAALLLLPDALRARTVVVGGS